MSERSDRATMVCMLAVLVGAGLLARVMGERIPLNEGFGFEAHSIYRPLTPKLWTRLADRSIDAYSIQRLLPFVAANLTLRILGQPLDGPRILGFFEVWNLVVLGAAVWTWLRLAAQLSISREGQWLGFLALFGSFAVLKLVPYYPVNIDTAALLLGVASLYFWVSGSVWRLLVVSLAGLIVWPTNVVVGTLLLLLAPRTKVPSRLGRVNLGWALAALAIIGLWGTFALSYWVVGLDIPHGLAPPVRALLPLGFLAVAAWTGAGLIPLLGPNDGWVAGTGEMERLWPSTHRLAAAAVLIGAWLLLTRMIASPAPPRLSAGEFVLRYLTLGATSRPAQFLIAHVTYLGPAILLVLVAWPETCRQLRSLGVGAVAVAAFAIVLGVDSESRQLTNLVPFVVLPAVVSVDRAGLARPLVPVMAVTGLAFSKVWLPINYAVAQGSEDGRLFPLAAGSFQSFPAQAWFLNFGPWISNEMLLLQGVAAGLGALWFWHVLKRAGA